MNWSSKFSSAIANFRRRKTPLNYNISADKLCTVFAPKAIPRNIHGQLCITEKYVGDRRDADNHMIRNAWRCEVLGGFGTYLITASALRPLHDLEITLYEELEEEAGLPPYPVLR